MLLFKRPPKPPGFDEMSTLIEAGREIDGGPHVRGRSVQPVTGLLRQGYWWLAYQWTNWLFACTICNGTWKMTLFPLACAPKPRSPASGVEDRPLLLHPYGKAAPSRHLSFADVRLEVDAEQRSGIGVFCQGEMSGPFRALPVSWLIEYAPGMRSPARLDPRSVEIVDEEVARILRAKTGAERLEIAFEMYDSVWRMLTSMLTADHPDWNEEQVRDEVIRRLSHGYTSG